MKISRRCFIGADFYPKSDPSEIQSTEEFNKGTTLPPTNVVSKRHGCYKSLFNLKFQWLDLLVPSSIKLKSVCYHLYFSANTYILLLSSVLSFLLSVRVWQQCITSFSFLSMAKFVASFPGMKPCQMNTPLQELFYQCCIQKKNSFCLIPCVHLLDKSTDHVGRLIFTRDLQWQLRLKRCAVMPLYSFPESERFKMGFLLL